MGGYLDVVYESLKFLKEVVKNHPDDWDNGRIRLLDLVLDNGEAVVGAEMKVNKFWPNFDPTKVIDAVLAR